jgi:hypothetical protein
MLRLVEVDDKNYVEVPHDPMGQINQVLGWLQNSSEAAALPEDFPELTVSRLRTEYSPSADIGDLLATVAADIIAMPEPHSRLDMRLYMSGISESLLELVAPNYASSLDAFRETRERSLGSEVLLVSRSVIESLGNIAVAPASVLAEEVAAIELIPQIPEDAVSEPMPTPLTPANSETPAQAAADTNETNVQNPPEQAAVTERRQPHAMNNGYSAEDLAVLFGVDVKTARKVLKELESTERSHVRPRKAADGRVSLHYVGEPSSHLVIAFEKRQQKTA